MNGWEHIGGLQQHQVPTFYSGDCAVQASHLLSTSKYTHHRRWKYIEHRIPYWNNTIITILCKVGYLNSSWMSHCHSTFNSLQQFISWYKVMRPCGRVVGRWMCVSHCVSPVCTLHQSCQSSLPQFISKPNCETDLVMVLAWLIRFWLCLIDTQCWANNNVMGLSLISLLVNINET